MDESPLIIIDPEVCAGKPVIRGTRVPVEYIVGMMRKGYSADAIAEEFDLPKDLVSKVLEVTEKTSAVKFA